MCRPVVQRGRIKIRAVWPDDGANFGINPNLVKKNRIAERPIQPPVQQRLEVDRLFHTVFKSQFQRMRRDDRDAFHKMDGMLLHDVTLHNLTEWCNRQRRFAGLQTLPVRLQFGFMQFRPGFNQPGLSSWKRTGNQFDGTDLINRDRIAGVSMEVRKMMRPSGFKKHPDDDAVES